MTMQEILRRLAAERKLGSRYPMRLIFLEDTSQYLELVGNLRTACDATLELGDFCSAPDVFPNFGKLMKKIKELRDKHILLLSLGEYLRLAVARELQKDKAQVPLLWTEQQPASSKTRVVVPLLFCRDLWDRVIPRIDERQKDFIWDLSVLSERENPSRVHKSNIFNLSVFSEEFSDALPEGRFVFGVKAWFSGWEDMITDRSKKCMIVTSLWGNTEQISSSIDVKVVSNVFDYIVASLKDGSVLQREWGKEADWACLSQKLHYGKTSAEVIKRCLNVYKFEPLSVLSRWESLSRFEQWLVWLWYRVNPSDGYCGYAIRRSRAPEEIVGSIMHSIFDCVEKSEWFDERSQAVASLNAELQNDEYFDRLDQVPSLETRLTLLSCVSHMEKTYALKTISCCLKKGIEFESVASPLRERFPLFWDYMTASANCFSPELASYLHWYRKHKIMNVLPSDATEIIKKIDLECFESRYAVLKAFESVDAFFLWNDAMGAEWLPLLLSCLETRIKDASFEAKVVCARAPTETSFNEQWKEMDAPYDKLDALDKLAHSGVPDDKDYYSCIACQFEQIEKIADAAVARLKNHDFVLITADHGTSRLAALAFHKLPGYTPPSGAIVRSLGRYCELQDTRPLKDIFPETSHIERDGKHFLVFKNHEHFTQSGNAAGKNDGDNANVGELHGGGAPEEILVPVVVLKRRIPLPLVPDLLTPTVFRENETVTVKLNFSKKVSCLTVCVGDLRAECFSAEKGREWKLLFKDLKPGKHCMHLEADGKRLEKACCFEVKTRGITEDDLFGE
ncbi:MAG: BREX-4 system phosphatase PglZ [Verrucomicrobiae bacterium]|nr:BREX-4 system phosphatase PglZ [Verrucomicrobiae bacterium]